MSSYELLELFGVTITDPETRVVRAWVYDLEARARFLRDISIPVDDEPVRKIRVDFAPDDGALASAMRGGERSEWRQMLAQAANELAVIRVVQAPDANAEDYSSRLFLPIGKHRELDEEQALRDEELRTEDTGGLYSLWQQP